MMQCSIAGLAYGPRANDLSQLIPELQASIPMNPANVDIATHFFAAIALCNTAVANKLADMIGVTADQATSFDEDALVSKLANLGVNITYLADKFVTISVFGKELKYRILHILEFDSYRQRMSVIVRAPNKSLYLYCKGVKTETFNRLTPASYNSATQAQVEEYVSEGWHTLAVCYKKISEDEYTTWKSTFKEAESVLVKRDGAVTNYMEKDMTLLGAVVQSFALQTMWDLTFPQLALPRCSEARAADMPYPFSKLLPFNHHMTHTLEAHYGQSTNLQVYTSKKTDNTYSRAITLSIPNSRYGGELKVQFALLCIYLQYIPEKAQKEILEEKMPMGRILKSNNISTHVQLQSVIKVEECPMLSKHMKLPAYGRTALIFCDGKPALHVLEILNGDCY